MDKIPSWAEKKVSISSLAQKAKRDKKFLAELLKGTESNDVQVKYKSAKVMRFISENNPKILYPHWSRFERRLSSENTFLRSDAMFVIANLTVVDKKNRFEKIFDKCYKQIDDPSMIPAANLVGISGKIALAKPDLQTRIVNMLIAIDKTNHSPECKNIIKGKAIESFSLFFEKTSYINQKKIMEFVKSEMKNSRNATKKKAEKFLRKWDK
jgi:hypothetical protein